MLLLYWPFFLSIAITDLRENRIPNALLLSLICVRATELIWHMDLSFGLESLISGLALFGIGLILFLIRAMSPGDVKLLFVVGFVTGVSDIGNLLYWILISGGLVASFCLFNERARSYDNSPLFSRVTSILNLRSTNQINKKEQVPKKAASTRYGDKLVMPFAPSIVIGMAMFYYFN
ncbi:hypothetical protein BCS96_02305 [Vibrio breoganii]|nr:hypothetical protein BCU93_15695 [Vibrio breoganii]PML84511.1 hypothetical protein BCT68_08280 [Vibrio breoganii]PMM48794.1 hypothetical protein BCT52_03980 [Vibrio breoganii]PMM84379.1 hypothetical protein BCT45_09705 [Vibrio breoganii]PMO90217.1 hypothetical protein BCS98_02405 [Vibrio breoganii]